MTMKKLIAAILMLSLLCTAALADGMQKSGSPAVDAQVDAAEQVDTAYSAWPAASDVVIELWTQNDERYLSNVGSYYDLAALGSDEYVAPRVKVYNHGSSEQPVSMSWSFDGNEVSFNDSKVSANDWESWTASKRTAEAHYGAGSHTVTVTVNEHVVGSMTYTLTNSGSSSGAFDTWRAGTTITTDFYSRTADDLATQYGNGATVHPSMLKEGEWFSPVLLLDNNSGIDSPDLSVSCTIDGVDSSSWSSFSNRDGYVTTLYLSENNAAKCSEPGSHYAVFTVNGIEVGRVNWTVTSGSQSGLGYVTSFYRRNDQELIAEYGANATVDPSMLGSGEWFTPTLDIINEGSTASPELNVSCTIDGTDSSSWSPVTFQAGDARTLSLGKNNANRCKEIGSHTAVFTVNGQQVASVSWNVSSGAGAAPAVPAAPAANTGAVTVPWGTYGDMTVSLWSQDASRYLEDCGSVGDLNKLSAGQYYAPRVRFNNQSSASVQVSMYWVLDGERLSFESFTVNLIGGSSQTLGQETASRYMNEGSHSLQVFVDGTQLCSFYWTIGRGVAGSQPVVPAAPAVTAPPAAPVVPAAPVAPAAPSGTQPHDVADPIYFNSAAELLAIFPHVTRFNEAVNQLTVYFDQTLAAGTKVRCFYYMNDGDYDSQYVTLTSNSDNVTFNLPNWKSSESVNVEFPLDASRWVLRTAQGDLASKYKTIDASFWRWSFNNTVFAPADFFFHVKNCQVIDYITFENNAMAGYSVWLRDAAGNPTAKVRMDQSSHVEWVDVYENGEEKETIYSSDSRINDYKWVEGSYALGF